MWYRNISSTEKTFYGVTFKPDEVKEVNGVINQKDMYPAQPPKAEKSTQKPAKPAQKSEAPENTQSVQADQKDITAE